MSVPARDSGTGEPPVNPKPKKQDVEQPSTMGGEKPWRDRLPAIIQQLPFWPFNYVSEEPDPNYPLINLNKLKAFTTQDAGINQALIDSTLARRRVGSARCRAPRSWTETAASGKRSAMRQTPPA